MEDRFTLVVLETSRGDFLDVKLFSPTARELAPESLDVDDDEDEDDDEDDVPERPSQPGAWRTEDRGVRAGRLVVGLDGEVESVRSVRCRSRSGT